MTTSLRTIRYALLVALLAIATASCSKRSAPVVEEPWVTDGESIRGEANAAGIATSYVAYFKDQQLERIIETRTSAKNARAEYVFTGARLTKFKGQAVGREAQLEIELDMKGAVTRALNATPEDIAAVRNRAQLLRSLALSRRATTSHTESPSSAPASH